MNELRSRGSHPRGTAHLRAPGFPGAGDPSWHTCRWNCPSATHGGFKRTQGFVSSPKLGTPAPSCQGDTGGPQQTALREQVTMSIVLPWPARWPCSSPAATSSEPPLEQAAEPEGPWEAGGPLGGDLRKEPAAGRARESESSPGGDMWHVLGSRHPAGLAACLAPGPGHRVGHRSPGPWSVHKRSRVSPPAQGADLARGVRPPARRPAPSHLQPHLPGQGPRLPGPRGLRLCLSCRQSPALPPAGPRPRAHGSLAVPRGVDKRPIHPSSADQPPRVRPGSRLPQG